MMQQMRRRYELEMKKFREERRDRVIKEKIPQATYNLRCAEEALMAYGNGSLLDRLRGRQAEKLEALQSNVRRAKAALDALHREKRTIGLNRAEWEALDSLPSWQEFRAQPGEIGKEACRLEALFCGQLLMSLLEENHAALAESRKLLRGDRAGEIISYDEQQRIHGSADSTGEKCGALLRRLRDALAAMDIAFEVPVYYRSPTAYVANAATNYIRLDRVGDAMDQALAAKKQIDSILEKLNA